VSVTIHWRPATDIGKSFDGGTSKTLEILKSVFGKRIILAHVDSLRAMAAATNDQFYNEVADIVERVGEIEIWGEY